MNTNLKKNKVVLITGSSRGIGASLANYFATNKYYTVINYSKSKDEAVKLYKNISKIILKTTKFPKLYVFTQRYCQGC